MVPNNPPGSHPHPRRQQKSFARWADKLENKKSEVIVDDIFYFIQQKVKPLTNQSKNNANHKNK